MKAFLLHITVKLQLTYIGVSQPKTLVGAELHATDSVYRAMLSHKQYQKCPA